MKSIGQTVRIAEQIGSEALAIMLRTAALILSPEDAEGDETLPPNVLARLQRDAWQVRETFEQLAAMEGIGDAIRDVAVISSAAGQRILAIVNLIDTLIEEAERLHGTKRGRGAYKRQQVKAALLYAARRGGYDVPWVPGFLEPALFSLGADLLIDFTVAHVNQNALWDVSALPAQPISLRSRFAGPLVLGLRTAIDWVSSMLAGLSWKIVLGANQLSPALRAMIDAFPQRDAEKLKALADLRDFLRANPHSISSLATLFSIGTQQAELLTQLSGPQKQAYVRELILIVLRQQGLYGGAPLRDRVIEAVVVVAIDATVAIFNRRALFK